MSNSEDAAKGSSSQESVLPAAPMVPIAPHVRTYTRFISSFEADVFTDWIDESVSFKTTCFIGDWSQALKLRVRGPEAKAFLEFLSTNHWPNFKQYTAKHSIMCRDDGIVMGEGLVMKFDEEDYLYTSGPGIVWAQFQHEHGRRKFNCTLENMTNDWYLFQIQGPQSVRVMEAATGSKITDLYFLYAKWMSIDGMKFLALRQGVSGERGYELWGSAKDAHAVYKAVVKAGEQYGIRELGYRAKLVNHVCRLLATIT
jgi:glycine cleavage system aminomethyltransferase T